MANLSLYLVDFLLSAPCLCEPSTYLFFCYKCWLSLLAIAVVDIIFSVE